MRRLAALGSATATVCVLGVLMLGPTPAAAQNLDELNVQNEDLGRKLRHPNAFRGDLSAPRSYRARPGGYTYRYFDHAKPSFQYFQQGQTYKWSWDLFPGGESRTYRDYRPPGYYGPVYNLYNYYPPGYRPWGW